MTQRKVRKQRSKERILDAAGRRLRAEGLAGAGIAAVMADAGLTHGAFYAHFADKDELMRAALTHALIDNRPAWIGRPRAEPWRERLARLARRYLTPSHRAQAADGCALAAVCSEATRGDDAFKQAYEQELLKSLSAICQIDFASAADEQADDALALMALTIGALTLSRAVHSDALSDRLLHAGISAAARLASSEDSPYDHTLNQDTDPNA